MLYECNDLWNFSIWFCDFEILQYSVISIFFFWFQGSLCDFESFYVILIFLCDFGIFYVIFKIQTCQPEIWKCNGHAILPKVDVWFAHEPLRYYHRVTRSWVFSAFQPLFSRSIILKRICLGREFPGNSDFRELF